MSVIYQGRGRPVLLEKAVFCALLVEPVSPNTEFVTSVASAEPTHHFSLSRVIRLSLSRGKFLPRTGFFLQNEIEKPKMRLLKGAVAIKRYFRFSAGGLCLMDTTLATIYVTISILYCSYLLSHCFFFQ